MDRGGCSGRYGLVVFESADPAAKPLAASVFARELRTAGAHRLARCQGGHLDARASAMPRRSSRSPISRPCSASTAPAPRSSVRVMQLTIGDDTVPADALVEQAERAPARFSPNVLLRPIVQDTLFPTICYVAGPSELAYLGQLGGVYERSASRCR